MAPGSDDAHGTATSVVPNRIVVLVPAGTGAETARSAADAVRREWSGLVRAVMRREAETPGMPSVQWVSVPGTADGDYATQWAAAQRLLVARKRLRDFEPMECFGRVVCSLSPRWPAEEKPRPVSRTMRRTTGWRPRTG
ncbi:hypothetical protein ACR6C2_08205 [Streptomyces sp. INA 01156]